ncbi:MAG TPA: hypothetical protein VHX61_04635 [Rhizomicrobium sp.]|jgi:hypothetical protein|nr:hypothetical protein [Rhizomicrobium sp.]
MKSYAIAICLSLLIASGFAGAQSLPVTTASPYLSAGQCVQATGSSTIQTSGCAGRRGVTTIGSSTSLDNSQCGSLIRTNGLAYYEVTLPSAPLTNCEFTFEPNVTGFYVNTLLGEAITGGTATFFGSTPEVRIPQ